MSSTFKYSKMHIGSSSSLVRRLLYMEVRMCIFVNTTASIGQVSVRERLVLYNM